MKADAIGLRRRVARRRRFWSARDSMRDARPAAAFPPALAVFPRPAFEDNFAPGLDSAE
jgi:hypothetical protein